MNLELLLGEAAAGFGIGVALGVRFDRRDNFLQEFDQASGELTRNEKTGEHAKKEVSLIPVANSLIIGSLTGLANVYWGAAMNLAGIGMGAISSYAGFKAGEYISRVKRRKSKLTDSETAELESILQDLKQKAVENNDIDETVQRFDSFFTKVTLAYKNPEICRKINTRVEELATEISYLSNVKKLKNFFNLTEKAGMGSCTLNPSLNGEPYIIILHEGKGYLNNFSKEGETAPEVDGLCFINGGRFEEAFPWNNQPETLLQTVEQKYKDKPVILVSGSSEIPLELKIVFSIQSFLNEQANKKRKESMH